MEKHFERGAGSQLMEGDCCSNETYVENKSFVFIFLRVKLLVITITRMKNLVSLSEKKQLLFKSLEHLTSPSRRSIQRAYKTEAPYSSLRGGHYRMIDQDIPSRANH